VGRPFLAKLDSEIAGVKAKRDTARETKAEREDWLSRHPELRHRLGALDRNINQLREAVHRERSIAHGVGRPTPAKEAGRDFGIELTIPLPRHR
jgi:hypothetical protein